jgi:hypothetical protein
MFTELTINNESYKLRLNARASVALEKALGKSPLAMLMKIDEGELPSLTDIIIILHAALQPLNHGITLEKTYDLYDAYVKEGHNLFDLIPVIIEIFQESGYLSKSQEQDKEEVQEKND